MATIEETMNGITEKIAKLNRKIMSCEDELAKYKMGRAMGFVQVDDFNKYRTFRVKEKEYLELAASAKQGAEDLLKEVSTKQTGLTGLTEPKGSPEKTGPMGPPEPKGSTGSTEKTTDSIENMQFNADGTPKADEVPKGNPYGNFMEKYQYLMYAVSKKYWINNPNTFLNQVRDGTLVEEELDYQINIVHTQHMNKLVVNTQCLKCHQWKTFKSANPDYKCTFCSVGFKPIRLQGFNIDNTIIQGAYC